MWRVRMRAVAIDAFREPGAPGAAIEAQGGAFDRRTRSIRAQLRFVVLALGVPFLGYLAVSSSLQFEQERKAVRQQMLGLARVTAARLDDHVGDILQVLALLSAVVDTGPDAVDRNDRLLHDLSHRLPAQTDNVSVWNRQGRNCGSLRSGFPEADVSARKFFVDAMARRGLALESPAAALSDGQIVSVFSLPVERDGRIVGVVALSSRLQRLQPLLVPEGPDPGGRVVTVLSAEGVVLARSIDPQLWTGMDLAKAGAQIAASIRQREGVRDGPSADGVDRIGGFTTAARVPWLVYVGWPVEAALAGVRSRLYESLAIGASLMALGLLTATFVARRVSDPLRQLEEDACAFERGHLSHRAQVSGFAEAESLASTLNRMADALRQRTSLVESSQAELRAMLDTEVMGIVKTVDRHIVWANIGAERLVGYGRSELIGQSTKVFFADAEAHRVAGEQAAAVLKTGRPYRTQQQILRRDGSRLWVDVQAVTLPGDPAETLVMLVDITPLRAAEEARVGALEIEAQNRQLLETDRLKNSFLANMSHELHTPLNAVIGLSYLLRQGHAADNPGTYQGYVEQIDRSGRQLLGLVNDMLQLAEAESGRMELNLTAVNLGTVVHDLVQVHRAAEGSDRIDIQVDIDPGIGAVVVDPIRLTQVLSQLLSNAIKFSPEGGQVMILARPEDPAAFRIDVEDRGIGIDQEQLPLLFKPFQQVSEGTTRAYPGAGLGLALARRIVEAHGGSLRVASTPGRGSVFTVVLPREAGAADAANVAESARAC